MSFSWIYARAIFYPTLWWNMLLGRWLRVRNWWDVVDDGMVIGAMPFRADARRLAELGVTGVVNTCEEYEGPVEEYRQHDISQFRMPTVDFTHPLIEDVENAVQFIDDQIKNGGKVYVHCKAGRARSATVVLCWLIKHKNMTAGEGQKLLLERRPHVNPRLTQRPVVIEFEKRTRG